MFRLAKIDQHSSSLIPKHVQHEAIRGVSRDLVDAIRSYHPHGPSMYAVVHWFGNLVRRVLVDGKELRQGKARVPSQIPRIEIDQAAGAPVDTLEERPAELARELIRRAVFIEMAPGISRHNTVTSLRWQLRRVYLPAFGAALAKNDAVKEKPDWLKLLMTAPKVACGMVLKKRLGDDAAPLFVEENGDEA
jgi:hypothetical protein